MTETLHLNGDAAVSQYSDYNVHIYLDLDLTGFTATAALKRQYTDLGEIDFGVEFLQRSNPAIIRMSLTHEQTSFLAPGTYKWELRIQSGGVGLVRTIARGNITVEAGI